jgi:RimJ/RimL family protein N-acetyltransferase
MGSAQAITPNRHQRPQFRRSSAVPARQPGRGDEFADPDLCHACDGKASRNVRRKLFLGGDTWLRPEPVDQDTWPMTTLEEIWPVFGLRIEAGPVELSAICDDDIPLLVDLTSGGIHEPGAMPFAIPWSAATDLAHEMAAYYWQTRAEFSPKAWTLDLIVRNEGVVVGCQGFHTRDFLVTRTGETGSWLGRAYQGVCVTLFDHFGAEEITSTAFLDNPASLAVSRKLGYVDNGQIRRQRREGELAVTQQLILRPDDLVRPMHSVDVQGAAAVRQLIGLSA